MSDLPRTIPSLLVELERLFPDKLPRVTKNNPFDPEEINRAIGAQEVIAFVRRCSERIK